MDTLLVPSMAELSVVGRALERERQQPHLALARLGVGPASAAAYARQLGSGPGDRIALIGWAGGLCAAAAIGGIVVASEALDGEGHRVACEVLPLPGALAGPVLTMAAPLLTEAAKRQAGAQTGAVAVEMEAFPLALWAAERQVRFYHVRVILDGVGESLPDVAGLLDESGGLARGWPGHLLARPALVPALLRLARRTQVVAPALATAARGICAAWRQAGPA
jgi:adenosylhomocysteine nucleosidase